MATGIISIGLHLTDFEVLSVLWLVLAAGAWLVLAADFTVRLLSDQDRWRSEADTPPALTAVAATTVLGTRLALLGWSVLAVFALVIAVAVWPLLLAFVIRRWGARMPGAAFLVCVSTQGIAVLSATLAARDHASWLDWVGLVFWCGGLVLCGLAFGHFDLRQVWTGRGDQWVAAGALAISALAGAELLGAHWTGTAHHVLRVLTLILLALNLIGYVILLLAEFARPRPDYDIRRWATVFPLGMTAVAVYTTAGVIDVPGLSALGRILLFVAVAAWLYTLVALLRARIRVGRV
ncbi:voltage-gated anion channel [Nocardia pseudobrasiliensis]|uniref:Voltage-gated anion channel n=2 Tax=Nocardia pseudobrasiliensis TaxID=45979 RepID=A0A370IB31_9NOCA|nr:voltage-gated anion channel [Nocardia pseudobrasiliensis]